MRVLTISNIVTFRFKTMLVNTACKIETKKNSLQSGAFYDNGIQFSSRVLLRTLLISLAWVMTVPGALGLYEFLTLTGISPSLAGLMDCGCKTCKKKIKFIKSCFLSFVKNAILTKLQVV